ncbi:class I SAM-dependent methyltransferase [Ideonella sp. BN130291]|uniref:class I SAM-dependent methyltransferase n=1 Tax=Ideonella sp. BN130291 TaxID=3112940 RepID=UPI002E27545E|nr:class I SAM-dependent methyltransferase [Ideonella sp. BN130291]
MHSAHQPPPARTAPFDAAAAPAATGPTAQAVVRTYGRFAPLYDRVFGAVLEPGRRAMTQAACSVRPQSVLEVGVGTGLTLAGYPRDARVTGIDLSPAMLERAMQRAAAMPERDITLALMNAERMSFADHSFDCVTVPYVLSVTPDPSRLVQEIRRVCKPGGHILIVNHFSGSRFWWLMERAVRRLADRIGFRSDFSFEDHILGHDWQVESVRPVNLFKLSRLVVLRNSPARPAPRLPLQQGHQPLEQEPS